MQSYFSQLPLVESETLEGHDVAVVVTGDYAPAPTGGNAPTVQCPSA